MVNLSESKKSSATSFLIPSWQTWPRLRHPETADDDEDDDDEDGVDEDEKDRVDDNHSFVSPTAALKMNFELPLHSRERAIWLKTAKGSNLQNQNS